MLKHLQKTYKTPFFSCCKRGENAKKRVLFGRFSALKGYKKPQKEYEKTLQNTDINY